MKAFLGFVKKEFYHIFRDRRSLIILFGMPIVQILLFGFAITNEINQVKIAILDRSKDATTQEIIHRISNSPYFTVTQLIEKESDITAVFKKGMVKAVIQFEPHFDEKLLREHRASVQIVTDATDPNTANTISNYITAILKDYQRDLNQNVTNFSTITPQIRLAYNPEIKSVFMFVPGVMTVILMLVSAMMTSISLTREKEMGTMEVLLVSPLKPYQVIVGKVIPYILLSLINATVIILLSIFVFGMPVKGSFMLLGAESLLFIITALSLGILISTVAKTQQTAMMISLMGLMLPVIILSGFIFPISSMPVILQVLSNLLPAKWFIIIIKGIMLKGVGIGSLWKESLILLGMTLFFIFLSVRNYQTRLES
ncbi:MAG TPA: ABC transporter permease [Flavobacteriaceae bacterium]|nr:ABC transporter permease [Flavobacteriaceae bacterium]MCB9213464.1 ABC transporter permease [Alteromonas sp.]HPF12233.1 ABC transporter permease [Flavobacteriaceae bacterium]HQU21980.1 ABC transporter permease [Flavobacteriaceae bacterium]HQU65879.1 ABC transporter permease [Flavobacteriaceae bacterium]